MRRTWGLAQRPDAVYAAVKDGIDRLGVKVLDDAVNATRTAKRQSKHDRSADGNRCRADRKRLHDVRAAADGAIKDQRNLTFYFIGNRVQHGDGSIGTIQRPSTMILPLPDKAREPRSHRPGIAWRLRAKYAAQRAFASPAAFWSAGTAPRPQSIPAKHCRTRLAQTRPRPWPSVRTTPYLTGRWQAFLYVARTTLSPCMAASLNVNS